MTEWRRTPYARSEHRWTARLVIRRLEHVARYRTGRGRAIAGSRTGLWPSPGREYGARHAAHGCDRRPTVETMEICIERRAEQWSDWRSRVYDIDADEVKALRDEGSTWHQVAERLGVSYEAAGQAGMA